MRLPTGRSDSLPRVSGYASAMMGATHTLVSVSTTAVVCSLTHQPPETSALLIGGAAMTARLPDIDQRIPFLEHRGPVTHSPWAAGLFTLCAIIALAFTPLGPALAVPLGLGLGAGVLTHQLADALTLSGVPLLWPLRTDDLHLLPSGLRIRTDGSMETIFGAMLALAVAYYFWSTYAPGH